MHEPYRRRLPHIMPPGETLFITVRLHGTVPYEVLKKLQQEHQQMLLKYKKIDEPMEEVKERFEGKYFVSFDAYLDGCSGNADWLKNSEVAQIVLDSLQFNHDVLYTLHAFCIMPNHVHVLLTPLKEDEPFFRVMQRLKSYTAVHANRLLNRTGKPFWASESYDNVVRNSKSFERIIAYILNNPVKAGLVENWEDWPFSFYRE